MSNHSGSFHTEASGSESALSDNVVSSGSDGAVCNSMAPQGSGSKHTESSVEETFEETSSSQPDITEHSQDIEVL